MSRKARRQVTDLVTPRLEEGEEILGAASPWAARLGRTPLLLTGRHLHLLALTDRRLIVFERRHRRHRRCRRPSSTSRSTGSSSRRHARASRCTR